MPRPKKKNKNKPGQTRPAGGPDVPEYENKLTKKQRSLYGGDRVIGAADLRRFTKKKMKGKDLSGKKKKKFESKIEKQFTSAAKSLLKPEEGKPLSFRTGRKFHQQFGIGLTHKAHRERRESLRKEAGKPPLKTPMDEWLKGRNKAGFKLRPDKKKNKKKNKGKKKGNNKPSGNNGGGKPSNY
jgi:hypothetical protein